MKASLSAFQIFFSYGIYLFARHGSPAFHLALWENTCRTALSVLGTRKCQISSGVNLDPYAGSWTGKKWDCYRVFIMDVLRDLSSALEAQYMVIDRDSSGVSTLSNKTLDRGLDDGGESIHCRSINHLTNFFPSIYLGEVS